MNAKIAILGVVVTLLTATKASYAYVPPSFYILKAMARKHAAIQKVQFKHKISILKGNGETSRSYTEVLTLDEGELASIKVFDDAGKELGSKSRRLTAGHIANRPILYDLLFAKDAAALFEHFKLLGLPLKTETELYSDKDDTAPYKPETYVSLMRHESRVYITIGDNSRGIESLRRSPSLWIEKDSLLPVRGTFPTPPQTGSLSEPLEFFIANYQPHGAFLYPKTTTIHRDDKPWVRIDLVEVKTNTVELPAATAKADADSETKDFLEQYFKWVR